MIRNETAQVLDQPKLIDAAVTIINAKLDLSFTWLGNTYGRVKKRRRNSDDDYRPKWTPTVPGTNDEINLFPDDHLGNHSFFYFLDDHELRYMSPDAMPATLLKGRLVFWFDIRDIYPSNWQTRNDLNVANDVLVVLQQTTVPGGVLTWTSIHLEPENVYAGFAWDQVDEIHYMRPKGCFAIEFTIFYEERC